MTQPRYRFGVLGPVTARLGEVEVQLGPRQQKSVLAVLLLRQQTPTPVGLLVDTLWAEPPKSAAMAVRSYVHRLRRAFAAAEEQVDADGPGGGLIATVGDSYVLHGAFDTDLTLFRDGLAAADEAQRRGDDELADRHRRAALAHWHDPPLAEVPDALAAAHRVNVQALHRSAIEADVRYELERGDLGRVTADLTLAVARDPLDERFRELLMLALYRGGRQAEALRVYREARHALAESLGVDPGPALQNLHEQILAADPKLVARPAADRRSAPARPRQLPADLPAFTARSAELSTLDALLSDPARPPVGVLCGAGGVGKTVLAVHWAHRHVDAFPDGQIYLDLRGFDEHGRPMTAGAATGVVLEALGVRPRDMPWEPAARAGLLRSIVADRRLLIVADNVASAAQVRSLVPATPGTTLLITSRNRLLGLLTTHGVDAVTVGPLSPADASQLLSDRLGERRLGDEPGALDAIVARCAGLPLALAIVASRVAARPSAALATICAELDSASPGLGGLALGDPEVDLREVLSWSYRGLEPSSARVFRLLALNPAADTSLDSASDLVAQRPAETRRLLDALYDAHLVEKSTVGRYRSHDLLRAYALEIGEGVDPPADRAAAQNRLLAGFLGRAQEAALALAPIDRPTFLDAAPAGRCPPDVDAALTWFADERAGLLDLVRHAAEHDDPRAWRLAWAFDRYLDQQGRWSEQWEVHTVALAGAQHLDDAEGQAFTHRGLARADANLGRHLEARRHIDAAIGLFTALDATAALATAYRVRTWVAEHSGDYRAALACAVDSRAFCDRAGLPPATRGAALNAVGWCHALLGEHQQALTVCAEALDLLGETPDAHPLADTWDSIGYAHHQLGQWQAACDAYRNAAEQYRAVGALSHEAKTLGHLASSLAAAGSHDAAEDCRRRSAELFDRLRRSAH